MNTPSYFTKITALLGVAVFLTMGLTTVHAVNVAALVDNIQAASGDKQKQAARQAGQMIAENVDGKTAAADIVALLNSLPRPLSGVLAGSIVIGAAQKNPVFLPLFNAAAVTANDTTIAVAPAILSEVTASAPLARASAIATPIGLAYAEHRTLMVQAPQLITAMAKQIIAKKGNAELTATQLADTIAALTVLLPGSDAERLGIIENISRDVAQMLEANKLSHLAPLIVGQLGSTLKAIGGSADTSALVARIGSAFSDSISNRAVKAEIASMVAAVNSGAVGTSSDFAAIIAAARPVTIEGPYVNDGPSGLTGVANAIQIPGTIFVFPPHRGAITPPDTLNQNQ